MFVTAGNQLVTNIFKALAHPTRIQIMKLLKNGPLCVCDIIDNLQSEQSNTSQHLNVLKSAGLVESRKEGLSVIYNVRSKEIYDVIDKVENIIFEQAENTKLLLKNAI
ncbi:MAG: metalloregulator ArsR/SmtB family transcription factor [Clostridiales bacterium]|jgi:ArsR family transcriptional regulator|nr:metalloregulator ArsR/SmtB family transcription factor [Eubacteriales bacterium]MDH7567472.1 metalloregulator ArsR/SmtB family transcription factor [Clostridiales bacterium]